MMNKIIQKSSLTILMLLVGMMAFAQNIAVESFTMDEADLSARAISPHKDQNNKVCAIIKIETPLLLQDFDFEAGMIAVTASEQKIGVIWVYLSPGARKITLNHKSLGSVRNYEFGEPLKEATVYIMKLRSGNVKTVIEEDVNLQYMVINCDIEGATVKIDDANPEPFVNAKFQKLLSYGKHKYTIEAPMYHPLSGIVEITASKSELKPVLQPAFGKLTINTQPEQGADVFVDGEKRGQTPLALVRVRSGNYNIRVMKNLFLPLTESITVTDGGNHALNLTLKPNFAVITLNADGAIYVNDELKDNNKWSNRLTPGTYKVEVKKISHRSSVTSIEVKAGDDKTINLQPPTPVYGSLDVKSNVNATIFIDGKKQDDTTPTLINKVLIGKHEIELQAKEHKPYKQTVEVMEGKIATINTTLQEMDKLATLVITANTTANVYINGTYIGTTPITKENLPLGQTKVSFSRKGYKTLDKTINLVSGENKIHGELQKEDKLATLVVTANMTTDVSINGTHAGTTPFTQYNLPLGQTRVSFSSKFPQYKTINKTINLVSGENKIHGVMKKTKTNEKTSTFFTPKKTFFFDYRGSVAKPFGFAMGYCNNFGCYLQGRLGGLEDVRMSFAAGVIVRTIGPIYLYGGLGGGSYSWTEKDYSSSAYYSEDWYKNIEGLEYDMGITLMLKY